MVKTRSDLPAADEASDQQAAEKAAKQSEKPSEKKSGEKSGGKSEDRSKGPVRPQEDPEARWREHPWIARVVRWSIFLIPVVVSFVFALVAGRTVPEADDFGMGLLRFLGIAAASTTLLLVLQRIAKRFVPLAVLFSLTLVFPDSAPSRFGLALRTGTPKQLQRKIDSVGEEGLGDTPREAAVKLLELVAALSKHDRLTRGHSERVRAYSRIIGEEMDLSSKELDRLQWAGLLHDVGKLYVPDEILNKPGRLTPEEYDVIKSHTVHGRRLVEPLAGWLGESVRAVWEHHERWEGGGYPTGVRAEETALASRIVAVADAFDVMTSARSYKRPMSPSKARAELQACAGTQFDPMVVRAMMSVSLGKLWAVLGPLSLIAQIRMFPRRLTNGGAAISAALAVTFSIFVTSAADGLPWVSARTTDAPVADAPEPTTPPSTAPPATAPPSTAPLVTAPPATVPATTVPETTVPPTTLPPATTVPATVAPVTTSPPTTAAPTTAPPATVPATVPPTAPPTTVAPTTVPPTTIPPAGPDLTLGTSGPGDVASSPVLDMGGGATGNAGSLPNYDTDRNDDPGLTIERSAEGVESADPRSVQAWRVPSEIRELTDPVRAQLWFAPATMPASGFMVVEAGLYDCDAAGTGCIEIARDVGVFQPTAPTAAGPTFHGVTFVLDLATGTYPVGAGRQIQLKVAVPSGSAADAIVAYATSQYPSTITLG